MTFLVVAAFVFLCADVVFGCVCVEVLDVATSLKQSDAVFAGEAVFISEKRAAFKVEKSWKGKVSAEVIMLMGGSTFKPKGKKPIEFPFTSCDSEFEVGGRYLVYASRMEGKYFRTWSCTRTRRLNSAGEDLRMLGTISST